MPFNLKMEDTIVSNADLLIEDDFPESLRLLCIHVAAYKPILKLWEQNNFSNHLSLFNFPRKELHVYVEEGFKGLKHEQARLLGLLGESIS
jgi:hypothetical protein